jgi:hypothetical protein
MNPLTDRVPTGSRALDVVFNGIDAVINAVLLVAFLVIGRRSKDWGPRQ